MVSMEQTCCAFLNFAISETSEDVRLTITAPERTRDVAYALFEQFVPPVVMRAQSDPSPAGGHQGGNEEDHSSRDTA